MIYKNEKHKRQYFEFLKGDRVESTKLALDNGLFEVPRLGEVVRDSIKFHQVEVRPDGRKTSARYHQDFWKRIK